MEKPKVNKAIKDEYMESGIYESGELKERRIRKEKDETYIPESDSSDSEDDDPNVIYIGGCRELLASSSTFSKKQRLLLEEQMRMYVQLTTQAFLLSIGHSAFHTFQLRAKKHLEEIAILASHQVSSEKSCFKSANISDAITILNYFDNQNAEDAEVAHQAKRILSESKVFMYPDLCPETAVLKLNVSTKLSFQEAEDNLIALGLETFKNNRINIEKIKKHYLPCRTELEIRQRITRASRKNAIRNFQLDGEIPERFIELRLFDETNIKAPVDNDPNVLPKWMERYVEIFKQDGPFPYFLESHKESVVKPLTTSHKPLTTSHKPLCNNLKTYKDSHPKSVKPELNLPAYVNPRSIRHVKPTSYTINKEIDLCQEFCDPKLVNCTNFTEFSTDIELGISMSGVVKLSSIKKSKPSFMPYDVNKQRRKSSSHLNCKKETDNLAQSPTLSCNVDLPMKNESTLSKGFSFSQVLPTKDYNDISLTPSIVSYESLSSSTEGEMIKIEDESDAVLSTNQRENLTPTFSSKVFPEIKIKQEPL